MMSEPHITFRNCASNPDTRELILAHITKLTEFCGDIVHCNVVIDVPHKHHQKGNQYQVRIDLGVPAEEIAISTQTPEHTESVDLHVAIRDAFAAMTRKLEDYLRRRRRFVKSHTELPPHARIRVVLPHADHGFLETPDGREIYFHRNSVINARFDELTAGPR